LAGEGGRRFADRVRGRFAPGVTLPLTRLAKPRHPLPQGERARRHPSDASYPARGAADHHGRGVGPAVPGAGVPVVPAAAFGAVGGSRRSSCSRAEWPVSAPTPANVHFTNPAPSITTNRGTDSTP